MIWPLLLLPLIPTFFRFLFACHGSLINLRSIEDYAILPFSPTDLSVADVVLVVCVFIGRSIRKALGYGHVHNVGPRSRGQSQELPSSQEADSLQVDEDALVHLRRLELAMPLNIRSSDIAQYLKAISSDSSEASGSYTNDTLISDLTHLTLFLSAISEPALLLLLARKGCPIEPLGSVNARNNFELLRPDLCKQIIKEAELTPAKSQASSSSPTISPGTSKDQTLENSVLASLPATARPVKRGLEIDITVSIYTRIREPKTETWGPSIEVFRQVFTVLQFTNTTTTTTNTNKSTTSKASTIALKPPTNPTPNLSSASTPTPSTTKTQTQTLTLPKSDPITWAKISKDYNPIHISSFAARAFGFKGIIAHGNHVVAKTLTTLPILLDINHNQNQNQDTSSAKTRTMTMIQGTARSSVTNSRAEKEKDEHIVGGETREQQGLYMNISFKRPILVPSEVGIRLVETLAEEEGETKSNGENAEDGKLQIEVFQGEKVNIEIEIGVLSAST